MSSHSVTVMMVTEGERTRCVVTDADDVIWVHPRLWEFASDPNRERTPGDVELDGDLLSFGTDGEGLGRVTYRRYGQTEQLGLRYITCSRVDTP